MNLVKSVLDQLTGSTLDSLASVAGSDAATTRTAAAAAVPALLSGLAGLASSDSGAKKVASALEGIDLGSASNLAKLVGGDCSSLVSMGTQLLSSLFGDGLLSSIAAAVGRFAGMNSSSSKSLLASLAPTVLGMLSSQWKSQGGSIATLTNLLADQKRHAAAALPAGFSLADIPGLSSAESTLRATGQSAKTADHAAEEATKASIPWVASLVGLALLALGLWYLFGRGNAVPVAAKNAVNNAAAATNTTVKRAADTVTTFRPELPALPALPDLKAVTGDLTGIFNSTTQALSGIRDAASAQAALPKLTETNAKIDGIRGMLDELPEATQSAIGQLVGQQLAPLQEQAAQIVALPGVQEPVKSVVDQITSKLAGLNLARVAQDATKIFASLTKTVGGVRNTVDAEAALPQLQETVAGLGNLSRIQAAMSPGGQSMLAKMAAAAHSSLEPILAKLLATVEIDLATIKPVLDQIQQRLAGMASALAAG